ncbi:polysaccharide deacetylase family protein [Neorhizobium sp. DT-125]|uniref:polysaccharide deacetylase family protein n=1 Tax=Neorhizobium sp. DT-125 TaxID=3396163 RepID=UPI003F1C414D
MLLRLLALLFLLGSSAWAQERTVYLTFDDGPLTGTATILKVLAAENVPAAMFMVGLHAKASADHLALVRQAKSMPLVTVGNHSYTHAENHYKHFYSNADQVLADLQEANLALELTKQPIPARLPGRDVFRLPGLSRDDFGLGRKEDGLEKPDFDEVAAAGFYLYGWDHEWLHDSTGKPVQPVEQLLSEIDVVFAKGGDAERNRLILLMHDEMFQGHFDGEANLTALISGLKQRGYAFGDISTYAETTVAAD